jgi:tetratricopeptide (TPR) repeat protein
MALISSYLPHYEEAVKLNPQNGNDYYQLGNIYLAQKRFAKSAEAYERAGVLGSTTDVYHFKLASVYFNLHHFLGTVTVAEVVGGKEGEIKNNLFLLDAVKGQKDAFYVAGPRSAVYQAAKAGEMGIHVFELKFLQANIWLAARRCANADALYRELEPEVKEADAGLFWFYWAQAALGLDDYDAYLARLEKAMVAEPDTYKPTWADSLVTVANRLHQQGDMKGYVDYLAKAVEQSPLSARLHLSLGDAHWLLGEKGQAVEQYRLVLELEPDHGDRVRILNRIRGRDSG